MADTPIAPLEITIRRSNRAQEFAPDLPSAGPSDAPLRPFGADPATDAGTQYLVQRQQQEAQDLDRWMRSHGGGAPSVPPPADVPAQGVSNTPQPAPGAAPDAMPAAAPGAPPPAGPAPKWGQGNPLEDLKAAAGALPKIGGEIVRAPRAALAGVAAAGKELAASVDSLAEWLNSNVADLKVPIGKTGSETVDALLANPAKAIGEAIAQPETPNTVSGPIVKDVAQFLAGMVGGGKLLKGAGVALQGGKAGLAAGAMSDALFFDPKEENLAALLGKVPALKGPVTDFMATDPGDNEAVNRLRRAVEGLGLGVATDALLAGLRAYRAQRAALKSESAPAKDAMAEAKAKYGELTQADLDARLGGKGDAEAKLVSFNEREGPTAEQLAAAADDPAKLAALKAEPKPAAGGLPGGRIAINWARIATGDDVKAVMREMADHFRSEIKTARRGKMAQAETQRLADELGLTVDDLLARREGQALNAEETLAARQLLTTATEKLLEAAKVAAAPNAGPVDLFAFRRMLATQAAIQNEVLAARAEAGRALASWKIPATAKGDVERSRAVLEALEAGGGEDLARDIARRIQTLADTGADAAGLNATARAAAGATKWEMVSEVWVNALLSNPKTHLVNIFSNTLALGQQILERGLAEKFATLLRADGVAAEGVAPGEAAAMISGLIAAQKDAWKMAWLALRSGETGHALGKVDVTHSAAITAENFRLEGGPLARAVDYLGTVERVPGRLLGAEDEWFKTIGYRMEVYAQAQRTAASEGLQGRALRERVADLVANPPENIRLQAVDAALYATFTSKAGAAAQALVRLREAWPATVFILPFVKTPINIVRYGFERTPVAPFMSSVRADLAAGGARAELAEARIALGTSVMLLAADYADRGLITGKGPNDPGKREALLRQGWQPYSIRMGDKWVSYDRADPYGMLFGFAADMAEFANRFEIDGDKLDEFSEIWAAGIAAVSQTTVNKTYLQGLSDFVWMVEDPKRRAFDYTGRWVGSFVPAGVNMMKQLGDPLAREQMKIWDYVDSRLPGFSEGLTPARDLWGKEKQPDAENGTAFNALSPGQVRHSGPAPIDAEMGRLNMNVERIDKRSVFAGAQLNFRDWPEVYDRYVVLAGNGWKNPAWGDKGAKDFLDETVAGRGPMGANYRTLTDGPEGGKATFIQGVVATARKGAQIAILADPHFAPFKDAWREQVDSQNAKRAPLQGVTPPKMPDVPVPPPPGAVTPLTAPR